MTCIDVQDLDAVLIQEARDPFKICPVADKNGVVPRRDKPLIVFIDYIYAISKIEKSPRDLPRFPSVRMVVRYGLTRF
jgi:hypothetical protein